MLGPKVAQISPHWTAKRPRRTQVGWQAGPARPVQARPDVFTKRPLSYLQSNPRYKNTIYMSHHLCT
jgi:hypothetical protein